MLGFPKIPELPEQIINREALLNKSRVLIMVGTIFLNQMFVCKLFLKLL